MHGALTFNSTTHDNFLLLGDFNVSPDGQILKEFCNSFSLGHLIKTPTYYMDTNPASIDLIITNITSLFIKSCILETGISDHHKLFAERFLARVNKMKNSFIAVIRTLIIKLLRRL